jgi:LPS-assembly lipoprotein
VALVAVLLTAGCGFRPLYGSYGFGSEAELSGVYIGNIPNREGQELRNFLVERMNPRGTAASPAYSLNVSLRQLRQELGIRRDETASRANLRVFADYTLEDNETGKTILKGQSVAINSFDILDQEFATVLAERDARTKALRTIADDITTKVAIFLTRENRTGRENAIGRAER